MATLDQNFQLQRRDSIDIVAEMLGLLNRSAASKTAMVYRANLNFKRVGRYLDLLVGSGLIEVLRTEDGGERYRITDKGREFLTRYRGLAECLNIFEQFGGSRLVKRAISPRRSILCFSHSRIAAVSSGTSLKLTSTVRASNSAAPHSYK